MHEAFANALLIFVLLVKPVENVQFFKLRPINLLNKDGLLDKKAT